MPKVSVIIPVYNVEKYLVRCLESLMKQTYKNYEVICVNDCSPDSSGDILKEYAQKYPDTILVIENEENMGQGRSRMCAIGQATGDYVMFVDSDDYVAADYIERFMQRAGESAYDVVVGGYIRDIDGKYKKCIPADSPWTLICQPMVWARLFRKDFILENGIDFSDVRAGEDIYFSMAVFYQDVKYKVIDYCGYYYYLNRVSTTGNLTYDKKLELVVSHMYRTFSQKFPLGKLPEGKRRMLEYTYIANMINSLITYGHGCKPHIMREKYQFFMKDMAQQFPDYRENPYFGIWKPKEANRKIRLGVGIIMLLHRVHLDSLLFWMISWL